MAGSIGVKSPEDVVIVSALRTPITRARKGPFKDTFPEELLAAVLKATIQKSGINPALVDDIQVGNVLPAGGGATTARMASLYAGCVDLNDALTSELNANHLRFPDTTSISTVNRQCSSGLQAVHYIAACIENGTIDIGIGAGVESMTHGYGPSAMPSGYSDKVLSHPAAADCNLPMG